MVRHGMSHASTAFVSVISVDLLGRKLAEYLPDVNTMVGEYMAPLLEMLGLNLNEGAVGSLMLVLLLGFSWGVAFHLLENHR